MPQIKLLFNGMIPGMENESLFFMALGKRVGGVISQHYLNVKHDVCGWRSE